MNIIIFVYFKSVNFNHYFWRTIWCGSFVYPKLCICALIYYSLEDSRNAQMNTENYSVKLYQIKECFFTEQCCSSHNFVVRFYQVGNETKHDIRKLLPR